MCLAVKWIGVGSERGAIITLFWYVRETRSVVDVAERAIVSYVWITTSIKDLK